ncbi:Sec-independent protein translocase protein TatB [Sutterella sp.]|uniref:Sec-independent protein translocase protein TatB n=1 Tax=Sutterella sp. TaxID=1981025 RepID=UPI0026E07091|nr:Sec-independent protein translocase protein TatB [Sutterella sp.]MDO5531284.1 Sec-independent protein translocase protein TatB [Sutterella sp.]
MFDFGFSEMMIVGVVALVVLGPERLPVVARKTGEWVGKAQRFVAQVKSDIDRETELSELKRIQDEAKNAVQDFKSSVEKEASGIETSVRSAADAADAAGKEAESAFNEVKNEAGTPAEASGGAATSQDIAEVYGWGDANTDDEIMTPAYAWSQPKTFEKRYHSGPSVDDLAREIERLRRELGMRDTQMGGTVGRRRGFSPRARSVRTRIYR